MQHVETCARRLEMGCETNRHSVSVLVFDWSEPNTQKKILEGCADSSQSARLKFMLTTQFDTVSIDDRAGTPNTAGGSSLSTQSQKVKQATMCAR